MSPEIWVAIISTFGLVVVAWISNSARVHAKHAQKDASAAREQVENNHRDPEGNVINLREEADERHTENAGLLRQILGTQKGMKADVRQIRTIIDRHSEQIWELEKTQPRQPTPRRR